MSLRKHNSYSGTLPDLAFRQDVQVVARQGDAARFWSHVGLPDSQGCRLWTASKVGKHGYEYGQFTTHANGKQTHIYAHRYAFETTYGPIQDGMVVCHACDVTACCTPDHLFLGTQGDNLRDAAGKGHFHVPRPTAHRVTTAELAIIDDLLAEGVKQIRIAERFGVSKCWISRYAKGDLRQYDRPGAPPHKRSPCARKFQKASGF